MSDNDLDRAIATVAEALERGDVGYHGLYSATQANYRDAWVELHMRINDRMNAGEFERYQPVMAWMTELMEHAPTAPPPSGENTTRYEGTR